MKLLVEQVENVKILTENANGKKNVYIHGIFLEGNTKNRNQRIYPIEVLKEAVQKYVDEYVSKNTALGELQHPAEPSVNLDRAAILIKELRIDGNNYLGKAKVLSTPMGNIVKNLIDEGVVFGVSSRALGSLQENYDGTKIVQPDLVISAVDVVSQPSAPNAWVQAINESKDWVMKDGIWVERFVEKVAKPQLKNMNKQKSEQVAISLFEQYISKIGKK